MNAAVKKEATYRDKPNLRKADYVEILEAMKTDYDDRSLTSATIDHQVRNY